MKHVMIAALLLGLIAGNGAAAAAEDLSLQEAMQVMLSTHPMVKASAATLEGYKGRADAASWIWLPKLSLKGIMSATPSKWGNPMEGGTDYDTWGPYVNMEFAAILPLYTFGKLAAVKEMAQAGVEVGEAQTGIVTGQLQITLARAYLGVQLAQSLEDIIREGEQYLVRARKFLEDLRDQDSKEYDDVDLLRLKVVEADVAARRLELDRGRDLGIAGMVQLTGLPAERVKELPKLKRFVVEEKDVEHYLQLAAANRPELKVLAAVMKVQENRVDLEVARFFPDFFFGFYYTLSRSWVIEEQGSPFAYDPFNTWGAGAGLGLEWKFDFAERVGTLDEQKASLRSMQAQALALLQKVDLEVRDAHSMLAQQREAIRLHEMAFKAARGWTIAKLDLYENGFAELRDLTDALKEFFTRKLTLEMAVMEYNLAAVKLAVACGVPWGDVAKVE